jgi:hypothetical protein
MGRRALVRAVATGGGALAFASEIFAETASYYVSRDLPSYVGQEGCANTASAGIEVKENIRKIARNAAQKNAKKILLDKTKGISQENWQSFVSSVVSDLKRRDQK